MTEKVWFITGTSRGFGRIWAQAALARGDRVAATARDVKTLTEMPPSPWIRLAPFGRSSITGEAVRT